MLTVVIPTRNRRNLLKTCLDAILKNSIIPNKIIIIDSSDLDQRINIHSLDKRIVYHTTQIQSAAIQRNIGMELVSKDSKYLAFLDDDVQIKSNYFVKLIETLESTGAVGVSGLAINPKSKTPARDSGSAINKLSRFFLNDSKKNGVILRSGVNIPVKIKSPHPIETQWLIGCSLWDYKIVKSLRFEKDFYGQSLGEDVIFSLKASSLGSLYVDTSVEICHLESKIMRPSSDKFLSMWIINRRRIIELSKNPKLNLIPYHWANFGKILQILFVIRQDKIEKIKGFIHGYKHILRFMNEN
jgi:glycosyltransferase involved in cell wall biosynthesis